eukprot:1855074-Amphidinium_carterae.1
MVKKIETGPGQGGVLLRKDIRLLVCYAKHHQSHSKIPDLNFPLPLKIPFDGVFGYYFVRTVTSPEFSQFNPKTS